MEWTDGWMPQWQFAEVHHIRSQASPKALLDAAEAHDPGDDRLIRIALGLRESPGRLAAALGLASALAERPRFGKADFLPLGRLGDAALAYGLVGRFWEPGYGLVQVADASAFKAFADGDATRITTLSRLVCADAPTRRRMALYWAVIRPVSGLIRQRLLAQIKRAAEA
jgi:hypothetical protein